MGICGKTENREMENRGLCLVHISVTEGEAIGVTFLCPFCMFPTISNLLLFSFSQPHQLHVVLGGHEDKKNEKARSIGGKKIKQKACEKPSSKRTSAQLLKKEPETEQKNTHTHTQKYLLPDEELTTAALLEEHYKDRDEYRVSTRYTRKSQSSRNMSTTSSRVLVLCRCKRKVFSVPFSQ